MKKKTKELVVRCIDYTLYMGELYFDIEERKELIKVRNDMENKQNEKRK